MSALPSLPLPFICSIGVLGVSTSPPALRCPEHLSLEFGAFYYTAPGEGTKPTSPYVGTIDLENHYHSILKAYPQSTPGLEKNVAGTRLPKFPGYRIPEQGQLQIVIKNANSTAVKLFLIPYNLKGLSREGKGGKTFLQQKSYTLAGASHGGKVEVDSNGGEASSSTKIPGRPVNAPSSSSSPTSKGRLRYAIHLQFCSPPITPVSSYKSQSHHPPSPQYYLHGSIRVVFASSRALDFSEKLRVVPESPDLHRELGNGEERFAAYRGPGADWELARKKAKAREKAKEELRTFGLGFGEGEAKHGSGETGLGEPRSLEGYTFVPSPSPLSPARYLASSSRSVPFTSFPSELPRLIPVERQPPNSTIQRSPSTKLYASPFSLTSVSKTLPSSAEKPRSSGLSRSRP